MVVNLKKVDISDGRFERFLLLVFASLVDVEGKIVFYQKRFIKSWNVSLSNWMSTRSVVKSVVKTKVESGQTQVRML